MRRPPSLSQPRDLLAVVNPRNGRSVNLEEAKKAEAERLQEEFDERERALVDLLAPRPARDLRSGLARLFRRSQPDAAAGDLAAVAQRILHSSDYPGGFPKKATCLWMPESSMVAVDYTLPGPKVVPAATGYRYVRTRGRIVSTQRPVKEVRDSYSLVVARVMLRSLRELFEGLPEIVSAVTINGFVDTVDVATGRDIRPALASVRTTREQIEALDFSRIEPTACLRYLGAMVSSSPSELVPVRPVLDLSMVDPRFVGTDDVLSSLGADRDLMELSPSEFEHLITNLFEKMGLETRQTQASRDGGVDCVAFNHDPVLGGKVVIQAKRYRNTVGVSAVRDLYGTVQNEGASKGILVTTSGYGPAAYEFAKNKPIELFEGSHLLYLLREHAGISATVRL